MYVFLIAALIAIAVLTIYSGVRRGRRGRAWLGVLLLTATIVFFALLDLWAEMLWFQSLGFIRRFWTVILALVGSKLAGALIGAAVVYLLVVVPGGRGRGAAVPVVLGVILGGVWGALSWEVILRYLFRVSTETSDPILGCETGFYLFTLPFYDRLLWLLLGLGALSLLSAFAPMLVFTPRRRRPGISLAAEEPAAGTWTALRISLAFLLLVAAVAAWLRTYHLMYSTWGAVTGPGWTDVHIRLPGFRLIAALSALLGVLMLVPATTARLKARYRRRGSRIPELRALTSPPALLALAAVLVLAVVPGLYQWLRVEPNEITLEKPYIEHNIRFTRLGFGLSHVEERDFPVSGEFTQETVDRNRNILSEIRLWDYRALKAVHKQFQEIRLYYEFHDVDIDRYRLGDRYRQVMVSAREMEIANLPEQSKTFVNERFKYTHGYGITMTPVSEFTPEGLPNFIVKDIPPQTGHRELTVEHPQIYYGELTRAHVFVNTSEEEFDHPRGDENVYTRYSGPGGVRIDNLWRKFVLGWRFDGTKFFLSSYPGSDSRVLFHRQVSERVRTIAPFLELDGDPYVVVAGGRLYWIVDAYTRSSLYPYSEPFRSREVIEFTEGSARRITTRVSRALDGANYVRNSVKAVIDAYNGAVSLYVFEPGDPIIQVWQRVFPDLFKTREEMPRELLAHIRYPADFLLAQGIVYAKYHMSDPEVFYNQEDLWVRATEKYYADVRPVEPYYVMWQLPGSDSAEFVLILPFTPKNRQVLIGWMAGLCDPDNYGRMLAYKFPKEKRVLGPQQMETKIDQDKFLSGQLTLWDQRGSRVIRGNVLAIPIEDTIVYVEPLYLQAETAAYPELRLVSVMHGDNLSYSESFPSALQGLLAGAIPVAPQPGRLVPADDLAGKASRAFESYLRLLGEQRFTEAARELEALRDYLRQMTAPGEGPRN